MRYEDRDHQSRLAYKHGTATMAPSTGLGNFEKLPRELRDMIYSLLMPWEDSSAHALAIARTCQDIHHEVTDLLYRRCRFVFEPLLTPQFGHYGHESSILVWLEHPLCKKSLHEGYILVRHLRICSYGNIEHNLANIPYEWCSGVSIEMRAPAVDDPGQLIICSRVIGILANALSSDNATTISIRLLGDWYKDGKLNVSVPEISSENAGGDIGLLLSLFGNRLMSDFHKCSDMQIRGPCIIFERLWPNDPGCARSENRLEGTRVNCELSVWELADIDEERDIFGDSWRGMIKAKIDYYLDRLSGKTVEYLVMWRWNNWDPEYERDTVANIGCCKKDEQKDKIHDLMQRWAVLQRMRELYPFGNESYREDRLVDVEERRQSPGYCSSCEGELSDFEDRLEEYILEECYWVRAAGNPSSGDLIWRTYLADIRFIERDVEVTRSRVRWAKSESDTDPLRVTEEENREDEEVLWKITRSRSNVAASQASGTA